MQSIRSRGLRPLTHAVLASLCFTLPACIEDVVVPPPPDQPYVPDAGIPIPPVQPPENYQAVYYDSLRFAQSVQPFLDIANCWVAGCHDASSQFGQFVLLPFPARGSAEMWSNLQFVTSGVDLSVTPFVAENTSFYQWATNNHAGTVFADPEALRGWLEDAAANYPTNPDSFDAAEFEAEVQPSLDRAGCGAQGCHDLQTGRSPSLVTAPLPGSAEMAANLREVINYIDLGAPYYENTELFIRATDNHAGRALAADDAGRLASWITSAMFAAAE